MLSAASHGTDQLIVQTPGAGAETVTYTPVSANSGTLDLASLTSLLTITDVEALTYDGQGDNDSLTIAGTSGDVFLDVRGARSASVFVEGSFGSVKTPVVIAKDLPERVVTVVKASPANEIVARCSEGSPLCGAVSPSSN